MLCNSSFLNSGLIEQLLLPKFNYRTASDWLAAYASVYCHQLAAWGAVSYCQITRNVLVFDHQQLIQLLVLKHDTCCGNDKLNLKRENNTNTHTTILLLVWNLSGTTWVSRYQKGKNQEG